MQLKSFLVICIFFSTKIFGQTSETRLKISQLTGDFYVYTTFKEYGGKPFSANAMYLVTDSGVVMFDAPWDTTQFQPLLDSIKFKHNKNVIICIATHFHEDRTGGLEFLKEKGVKTYTTKLTDNISAERKEKRAAFLIYKDSTFKVGQYSFEIYYPGEGHSPDNIVIWFDKAKILYGGCLIKSIEANDLGNLSDANVKQWSQTINNIQKRFKNPGYIITGHQDWNSTESLTHTLELVKEYNKKNH